MRLVIYILIIGCFGLGCTYKVDNDCSRHNLIFNIDSIQVYRECIEEVYIDSQYVDIVKLQYDLPKISKIELERCKLGDIDRLLKHLSQIKTLRYLLIDFGRREIPVSIAMLQQIDELVILVDSMKRIPKEINNLKNITRLSIISDCYDNQINYGMLNLRELYLSSNLDSFPMSILEAKYLEVLSLSFNKRLTAIPRNINRLKKLKTIELYNTGITDLDWAEFKTNKEHFVRLEEIKMNCNQCEVLSNISSFK